MAAPSWFRCTGSALKAVFDGRKLESLEDAAHVMACITKSQMPLNIRALQAGWQLVVEKAHANAQIDHILGRLRTWAENAAAKEPHGSLERANTWIVNNEDCRDILASAFWCNLEDPMRNEKRFQGGLDWRLMYRGGFLSANKLACLWNYFIICAAEEQQGNVSCRDVSFELVVGPGPEPFQHMLEMQTEVLGELEVNVHNGLMEDVDADSFVNFANALFGYGRFIESMTQEEVLQMCCPEFNVGMLVISMMEGDEVVVAANCRRFSTYTGYLESFKFCGALTGEPYVQDILTLDATTHLHFSPAYNLRDVYKAFLGFKGHTSISSGRWGCGVFGGQVDHKMLQQIIAAKAAGCKVLHLSAFKDTACQKDGMRIAEYCRGRSVAELYGLLMRYSSARGRVVHFLDSLKADEACDHKQAPSQPSISEMV